jgi:hypothetical protein
MVAAKTTMCEDHMYHWGSYNALKLSAGANVLEGEAETPMEYLVCARDCTHLIENSLGQIIC